MNGDKHVLDIVADLLPWKEMRERGLNEVRSVVDSGQVLLSGICANKLLSGRYLLSCGGSVQVSLVHSTKQQRMETLWCSLSKSHPFWNNLP